MGKAASASPGPGRPPDPGRPAGRADRELPVRRPAQRPGQPGAEVAPGRVELGLDQEQAAAQVRAAQVGAAQVRPGQVRAAQVDTAQVRPDQVRPAQVGAGQVRPPQVARRSGRPPGGRGRPGRGPAHWYGSAARWRPAGVSEGRPPPTPRACRGSAVRSRRGRTRSSACSGPAARRPSASVRYQSSSCSCRMTANAWNICPAVSGALRQSCPAKVTWATFCPAPKQSKTVQPGKPRSRRLVWMPQRKSARRFGQGCPAGLSMAKSAEAANAGATQHNPKQRAQSARRSSRPPRRAVLSRTRWTGLPSLVRGQVYVKH